MIEEAAEGFMFAGALIPRCGSAARITQLHADFTAILTRAFDDLQQPIARLMQGVNIATRSLVTPQHPLTSALHALLTRCVTHHISKHYKGSYTVLMNTSLNAVTFNWQHCTKDLDRIKSAQH